MSFSSQQSISNILHARNDEWSQGFYPGTNPACVTASNTLQLFWYGSANDGVYTITYAGGLWGHPAKLSGFPAKQGNTVGLCTAIEVPTSQQDLPYLVVIGDQEDKGLEYTSPPTGQPTSLDINMGALLQTFPGATFHDSKLWLFWEGSHDDGVFYSIDQSGTGNWQQQAQVPGLPSQVNTGLAAVSFQGYLHLFYNAGQQSGGDFDQLGHTILNGDNWISHDVPSNFTLRSGPAVASNGSELLVVWHGDDDRVYYATWSPSDTWGEATAVPDASIASDSSPAVAYFPAESQYYIFWNGSGDDGTWFSSGTP